MALETVALKDVLHGMAQAMLVPTIIGLILLAGFTVYQIGSVIAERLTERRRLRARLPELLRRLDGAAGPDLPEIIEGSGMLRRQKRAMGVLIDAQALPEETRVALARELLSAEEAHYARIVGRTDTVARIGPMLGLMGTLIPLAPGLTALAEGDVRVLSQSLMVAFDTTIVGLAAAAVCYVISKTRTRWYEQYGVTLETVLSAVLERLGRSAQSTTAAGGDA